MDSLKLDRFRKLLNRQNTSINLTDGYQQPQQSAAPANAGCEQHQSHQQQQSATTTTTTNKISGSLALHTAQSETARFSFSAITVNPPPEFITKDNPKPAHFIARKLFCDFTELAHIKIDSILSAVAGSYDTTSATTTTTKSATTGTMAVTTYQSQAHGTNQNGHHHHGSIFRTLQRDEDLIYDQVLRALGTISEHCMPSLLKYLLLWYHQQLDAYAERAASPQLLPIDESSAGISSPPPPKRYLPNESNHQQDIDSSAANKDLHHSLEISSSLDQAVESAAVPIVTCDQQQQHQQQQQQPAECGCISPCNNESHSLSNSTGPNPSSLFRSPTPSSPDTSGNLISITSTLPLEYQSPAPQTTFIHKDPAEGGQHQPQGQQSGSAANTSASSATNVSLNSTSLEKSINLTKRSEITVMRAALVEYAFCQALIEIFGKLYLHPGHEDLLGQVEEIAFQHFRFVSEQDLHGMALADVKRLAEKYAEVTGVLAQTRFRSVKKRCFAELAQLKSREPTIENIQSICALLTGMRSFRVKMAPIEEFEASFRFLQELADYFVEMRHKSIKHSLAELFVEILLPLASIVKNEVKIPCLKNFVETLWVPTLDMCARKKHSATLFPLVTCLLCVSQRAVFLQNWGSFLTMCLSNLKNRDPKMCRIALESLYRIIWIYMIRVKGESNNVTQARLATIVDALFPRGSRQIVPREMPLVIFVDIIQFIAQERLDFAMRHIIFDLLSVDRSIKMITAPERMNIGLQAFLVIADNLQQKEGESVMPISIGSASAQQLAQIMHPSCSAPAPAGHCHNQAQHPCETTASGGGGGCYNARRSAHKMLNDETAKSIGLHPYYNHLQKSFNEILKALDAQFGRPLMLTSISSTTAGSGGGGGSSGGGAKELDGSDLISGDRRLRVDLFKTCIAAIPRLMPDGMSKGELIDLLARMTVHVDAEMRKYAFESLRKLVAEFQDWRLDAIEGFTLFLANQIDESLWNLVDSALKMLLQLLISWHSIITSTGSNSSSGRGHLSSTSTGNGGGAPADAGSLLAKSNSIVTIQTGYETISSRNSGTGGQIVARKNRALAEMRLIQSELSNTRFDRLVNVIQKVEGASLVMLCSCHSTTRKLASLSLRECRAILRCYSSWTCMEQFGFSSPDDVVFDRERDNGGGGAGYEEDLSASLKGSLSADNLSRITTNSINGLAYSSMTSINTQTAMLSTSVSKMCLGGGGGQQVAYGANANFNAFPPISGTMSASNNNNNNNNNNSGNQRDLYDEDAEANHMLECGASHAAGGKADSPSTTIFWVAVMILESTRESEYAFALRLLKKILPDLPLGREDFLEQLDRDLKQMEWDNFSGLHALVLKGCASPQTYELCISLLDHLTPILGHSICTRERSALGSIADAADAAPVPGVGGRCAAAAERALPYHVLVLSTYLLSTYEDPCSFSLNVARRLALCCEENSSKLENLAAVITLYSRRSFSKDAFQWIKCVTKYLHDACPDILPKTIPLLLDLLTTGPHQIQRLTLPILYCILTYATDISAEPTADFNEQVLMRLHNKCLGSTHLWRDAMQIFRLIIARSSSLANKSASQCNNGELPGRTMDFSIEIDGVPLIAKDRLGEHGILPNACVMAQAQAVQAAPAVAPTSVSQPRCHQQQQQQQPQPLLQPQSIADDSCS